MSGAYEVIRFYRDSDDRDVVAIGLTLEEAVAHCKDSEASSWTATDVDAVQRTLEKGPWFEGFREELP